ncbi:hypothetical protein [Streptomyces sp. LaBMicrA B280]|uniref:hypothetical protein n=1 Tax=Streptomyces sp. LaBMicrA B280 TaxID=3391001 RepID=UPI003BA57617
MREDVENDDGSVEESEPYDEDEYEYEERYAYEADPVAFLLDGGPVSRSRPRSWTC